MSTENTNGSSDLTRLDRIEKIVEVLANTQADLQVDVKILIKGQIVMGDKMVVMGDKIEQGFAKLTEGLAQLAAAQKRTEESLQQTDARMDALILTVDEIVRGRKPEAPPA